MRTLTVRERRIVALGVLAALVGLGWLAVVAPVLEGFHVRGERRREALQRQARDQRLLASLPVLRKALAEQKRTGRAFQITAPSRGLAIDALKQRLTSSLGQEGAVVGPAEEVRAETPAGWVSVRADATLTLAQLNAGVRRIENEAPYVVVDYVSINAEQAARTGQPGPLAIRLQISALHVLPPQAR
ncbi:type II secretion system protein GspM [Caulobacter endophyticus]|uniref:type II secretion system protein GspM n=1 Tax=Caulobacter endophyticus TaxID=2172652 RepID=UPI00240F1A57|nr:type II secretion system protein GspM [Caulobacter endophyticus]MDG2527270.1 type II secretion system protein GspM [Caulobacter endophyticus]